jgi:hypothetical protein
MSINTPQSEYMLLFRGTDWHKGLSPETVQTVMNQWYDWFERLAEQGKPLPVILAYKARSSRARKARPSSTVHLSDPRRRSADFLLHVEPGGSH